MFDSGVRGASDVFKALALGAKFVFVGRLWVWGLSIMGEHGVRHVMVNGVMSMRDGQLTGERAGQVLRR